VNIVRTIVWVLLLAVLLIFAVANWDQDVEVQIWDNLVWDTKLPAVVVVSFLIGLVPMWLLHRATQWRLQRKIGSLEASARAAALASTASAPGTAQPASTTGPALHGGVDDRSGSRAEPRPHSHAQTHLDPHPDGGEHRPGITARVDEFGKRVP